MTWNDRITAIVLLVLWLLICRYTWKIVECYMECLYRKHDPLKEYESYSRNDYLKEQ